MNHIITKEAIRGTWTSNTLKTLVVGNQWKSILRGRKQTTTLSIFSQTVITKKSCTGCICSLFLGWGGKTVELIAMSTWHFGYEWYLHGRPKKIISAKVKRNLANDLNPDGFYLVWCLYGRFFFILSMYWKVKSDCKVKAGDHERICKGAQGQPQPSFLNQSAL